MSDIKRLAKVAVQHWKEGNLAEYYDEKDLRELNLWVNSPNRTDNPIFLRISRQMEEMKDTEIVEINKEIAAVRMKIQEKE